MLGLPTGGPSGSLPAGASRAHFLYMGTAWFELMVCWAGIVTVTLLDGIHMTSIILMKVRLACRHKNQSALDPV